MPVHELNLPVVLIIAGHDPSGAAGVQADIESIQACGAASASLITATTTQDTTGFLAMHPQHVEDFARQSQLLCADQRFAACKIGLLGNAAIADVVTQVLERLGGLPVVLDPILRTGSGTDVADPALATVLAGRLARLATVMTPNVAEARALTGASSPEAAAHTLLDRGAGAVLITGADDDTPTVVNRLWLGTGMALQFEYPRLEGVYHGSGCTLSSSLAAFLAAGNTVPEAARLAQEFTWHALAHGGRRGHGQLHPNRSAGASGRPPG